MGVYQAIQRVNLIENKNKSNDTRSLSLHTIVFSQYASQHSFYKLNIAFIIAHIAFRQILHNVLLSLLTGLLYRFLQLLLWIVVYVSFVRSATEGMIELDNALYLIVAVGNNGELRGE